MNLQSLLCFIFLHSTLTYADAPIKQPITVKQDVGQMYLYNAIMNPRSDASEVYRAITEGADVNKPINGQSPLVVATLMNNASAAKGLINNGADLNVTYQRYPLAFYAIKKGYYDIADALIAKGASFKGSLNGKDVFTHVAMLANGKKIAYEREIDEYIRLLATMSKNGYNTSAAFNTKDLSQNPFYIALKDNNTIMISFYLNQLTYDYYKLANPANPNTLFSFPNGNSTTPLIIAIDNVINEQNALKTAAISSGQSKIASLKTIETLIKAGADLNLSVTEKIAYNKREHTPLSYAIAHSADGSLIDLLQKNKASLPQAITLLLQNKYSPNKPVTYRVYDVNIPLLYMAIEAKDYVTVKKLLDAGADYDTAHEVLTTVAGYREKKSLTPLQAALMTNDQRIIELLIQKGAE